MKALFFLTTILTIAQTAFAQTSGNTERVARPERSRDYNAINYKVELSVDPVQKRLEGQNTITITPLCDNFDKVTIY